VVWFTCQILRNPSPSATPHCKDQTAFISVMYLLLDAYLMTVNGWRWGKKNT